MDARSRSLDPLSTRLVAAAVFVFLIGQTVLVSAQVPDALVLLPRCDEPFGGERFRRLLALELSLANVNTMEVRELGAGEAEPEREASLIVRIEASCEVGGRAVISASGGPGAPSVYQVLDLVEVDPTTRARAIALATAEQVRLQRLLVAHAAESASLEGARAAPPSASSVVTRRAALISPARSEESVERPRGVEEPVGLGPPATGTLWLAFEGRGFPELSTWPLGLRIGAAFVVSPLHIGFDAGAGFASAAHPSGRIELWVLTAGISIGARWQVTPEIGVTLNLRADFGFVALTGFPREGEPRRGQGASLVTVVSVRVDASVGEHFQLFGDLDLGPTLVANIARAGMEEEVAGVSGLALALRLGFAFDL